MSEILQFGVWQVRHRQGTPVLVLGNVEVGFSPQFHQHAKWGIRNTEGTVVFMLGTGEVSFDHITAIKMSANLNIAISMAREYVGAKKGESVDYLDTAQKVADELRAAGKAARQAIGAPRVELGIGYLSDANENELERQRRQSPTAVLTPKEGRS